MRTPNVRAQPATDTSLGSQLDDVRGFINAQPATTSVGVGYTRNGTVQIALDTPPTVFKTDTSLLEPL